MAKAVSLKKNFFYSSFLTTANYLFTFITYPYVSRVLGVDRIGTVNFIDSVINYCIMLSMLGIAIVGIREVAKTKNNRAELDSTFSSLLVLNIGFTVVAVVGLGCLYCLLPELRVHPHLMLLGLAKLVANVFLMDWFFKGVENFKAITIRTFVVRVFYVAGTFLLIHSPEDYKIYYALLALSISANALINCVWMRRLVSFSFKSLQIKRFLTPVLVLGLYMLFGNFYSSFNTMILGVESGETEVGYFSTATKLFTIIISLFSAFTSVMMPRMSSLLKEGDVVQYRELFGKSISLLIAFCLPAILLIEFQARNIILIVSGDGYEGAVVPMMICMPLLLIIGYNQILINQGLMPLSKDKAILSASVCGGVLAFVLCFVLIPLYKSVGSAVLWVLSEITVGAISGYFVYRFIGIVFPLARFVMDVIYHLPLVALLYVVRDVSEHPFVSLTVGGGVTLVYCFILQCFVLKDETIRGLFRISNKKKGT